MPHILCVSNSSSLLISGRPLVGWCFAHHCASFSHVIRSTQGMVCCVGSVHLLGPLSLNTSPPLFYRRRMDADDAHRALLGLITCCVGERGDYVAGRQQQQQQRHLPPTLIFWGVGRLHHPCCRLDIIIWKCIQKRSKNRQQTNW